jgi:hypothetical protein
MLPAQSLIAVGDYLPAASSFRTDVLAMFAWKVTYGTWADLLIGGRWALVDYASDPFTCHVDETEPQM